MTAVAVLILHPAAAPRAGELERWVAADRAARADEHQSEFLRAGASKVEILAGGSDGRSFGARLRDFVARTHPAGLVVLGSGAIPLARAADRRRFVDAAARDERVALANNRYSADVVAIALAVSLADLPDLASDNALPRWLEEAAGYDVADLRDRWRLGVDIDGPIDILLAGGAVPVPPTVEIDRVANRLTAIRSVAGDQRAELTVAGRTSAGTLAWLERASAARTRALVEERGLRTGVGGQRPPASVLGALLERDGSGSLGAHLARLGEAAIVDSRVLLAHRFGADQAAWPGAEDRFASDLLLHERIADPWLRALTRSAATASIPVLLGGHTLVGPGLRLALAGRR